MSPRGYWDTRPTAETRFWSQVDASGDCWIWTGLRSPSGYGRFFWTEDGKRKDGRAHRWVWEHLVGPIPTGFTIDHLCKNLICVNPDHLEPVTAGTNVLRGASFVADNFRKVECHRGHWFSLENTYVDKTGRRHCRICGRATMRAIRAARKAAV